jgi:ubiquinone/menaquinone biosynthesis C-methylase UbiE
LVADMEQLPFENQSFDVVTSAGSLSYGEAQKVDQEILRVLKPDGYFICVDSLNNNSVYKLNRYIHYLMGDRSKMTLQNMPSLKRISSISKKYKEIEVKYFGSISFLMPLLSKFLSDNTVDDLSKNIDKIVKVRESAFKFVMVIKK